MCLGALRDKNPGDDLLLHGLGHTTIGAAAFHFRVRDGIGWFHSAMVARERVEGRVGSGVMELSRSRSRRGDVANIFWRYRDRQRVVEGKAS